MTATSHAPRVEPGPASTGQAPRRRAEPSRRLVVEVPESVYRRLRQRTLYTDQDLQSMLADAVERYLDADLIAEWLAE